MKKIIITSLALFTFLIFSGLGLVVLFSNSFGVNVDNSGLLPQFEFTTLDEKAMDVKESTVYPILTRLSKENLLTSYMAPSSDGPPRKYYKITETGLKEYESRKHEWLEFQAAITLFLKAQN